MAREIHDILEHGVSITVLHAEATKPARADQPAVVDRTLSTVTDTGRTALAHPRLLLAVLDILARADGTRPYAPTRLLEPEGAGRPLRSGPRRLTRPPPDRPGGAHRWVKHAAPDARARVDIDFGRTALPRTVSISAHNEPGRATPQGPSSSGRGRAGMRGCCSPTQVWSDRARTPRAGPRGAPCSQRSLRRDPQWFRGKSSGTSSFPRYTVEPTPDREISEGALWRRRPCPTWP
ncbi:MULTISPECIES: histidine kinase dimerization/phosphoacceptor domain-containing protein [Streptomycetaceae]|uniref:histidine kinase n=1 Tax=Embleya scabrispora TaxID=159449 RepID=UPI00099E2CF0|nr:hypothetical protein [Streptomyces sp. SID5474]